MTQEKRLTESCDGANPRQLPAGALLVPVQRYRQVFATLLEALSQHSDHVFMVIQKLLNQLTESSLHILVLNLQSESQQKQHLSPATSAHWLISLLGKQNTLAFPRIPALRVEMSSQFLRETICVVNFSAGINPHWKTTCLLAAVVQTFSAKLNC